MIRAVRLPIHPIVPEMFFLRIDVCACTSPSQYRMDLAEQELALQKLSYRNEGFLITENGLTNQNVMEYFYQSPFYTETNGHVSINEMIRRGTIAPASASRIDGDIYMLVSSNNEMLTDQSVYVIQKFKQTVNRPLQPLFVFYVISGTIFLAPGLGKLVERHLTNALQDFDRMFTNIRKAVMVKECDMDESS